MRRRSFIIGACAAASSCVAEQHAPQPETNARTPENATPSVAPTSWASHILGEMNVERVGGGALNVTSTTTSAVSEMMRFRGRGYNPSCYLTEPLQYGDATIVGRGSPETMCVGAVYEALVRAIHLASQSPEFATAAQRFPATRMDTQLFRAWMFANPFANLPRERNGRRYGIVLESSDGSRQTRNDYSKSNGAADAFVMYGIGGRVAFVDARPGDFLSFNRIGGSGHAAIIVRFIAADGTYTLEAAADTIGVLYFSAQGSTSGLDFREEYFTRGAGSPLCQRTSAGGCRVVETDDGEHLAVARLWSPDLWQTEEQLQRYRYNSLTLGTVSVREAQELNARKGWEVPEMWSEEALERFPIADALLEDVDLTAGLNIE